MATTLSSFIKNPKGMRFYGEDSDEFILYIIRRALITNVDWIIVALLMLSVPPLVVFLYIVAPEAGFPQLSLQLAIVLILMWYIFTFGFILHSFSNWFFNVYIITNKKVVDMDFHGIMYKNVSEASLRSVEDVTSTISGTLGVIFNYGDVYIQTAGKKREIEFESVDNPTRVRNIVSDLVIGAKNGNWKPL